MEIHNDDIRFFEGVEKKRNYELMTCLNVRAIEGRFATLEKNNTIVGIKLQNDQLCLILDPKLEEEDIQLDEMPEEKKIEEEIIEEEEPDVMNVFKSKKKNK